MRRWYKANMINKDSALHHSLMSVAGSCSVVHFCYGRARTQGK